MRYLALNYDIQKLGDRLRMLMEELPRVDAVKKLERRGGAVRRRISRTTTSRPSKAC
jgi:hypothetical protein